MEIQYSRVPETEEKIKTESNRKWDSEWASYSALNGNFLCEPLVKPDERYEENESRKINIH